MFCPKCGKEIPDSATICLYCNSAVSPGLPPVDISELMKLRCPHCGVYGVPEKKKLFSTHEIITGVFLVLVLPPVGAVYFTIKYMKRNGDTNDYICPNCKKEIDIDPGIL
ncbi:MAG: zinc ribbon domain-containing protein [Clostridia bacterium]|nr:zinc ribbon domain-containing protein [Clostridia bacterium]